MMNKADLRTGMVVELRNGDKYMVLCGELPTKSYGTQSILLISKDGFQGIERYSDDLRNIKNSCYDIMEVSKVNIIGFDKVLSRPGIPLWTRQPDVDWSKVAVDTKVSVSDDGKQWIARHFAECHHGRVRTWDNGGTSFTVNTNSVWNYAKLA